MAHSAEVLQSLKAGDVISERSPMYLDRAEDLELHLLKRAENGMMTFNVCLYGFKLLSLVAKPDGDGYKWLPMRL